MDNTERHIIAILHFLWPKQLGANGYIFAIDPNGYLLLHPNLQPKVIYKNILSLWDNIQLMISTLLYLFYIYIYVKCVFPHSIPLSLWTSLSLWHWTSWMQRWRTAIKRRWALNLVPSGAEKFLVSGIFCSMLLLSSCSKLFQGQRTTLSASGNWRPM